MTVYAACGQPFCLHLRLLSVCRRYALPRMRRWLIRGTSGTPPP